MSYNFDEEQTRNFLPRFTVDEWIEFRERLNMLIENNLVTERDGKLLTEIIVNMKSTAHLAYLARTDKTYNWVCSNQGKPMSVRRIQQILTQYFPEFHIHKTHKKENKNQKIRTEQTKLREVLITPESCCGKCGCKENLEIHHLMPVLFGGDNDIRNLILLCSKCHDDASIYFRHRLNHLKKSGEFDNLYNCIKGA